LAQGSCVSSRLSMVSMWVAACFALPLTSQTTVGSGSTRTDGGGQEQELTTAVQIAMDFDRIALAQHTQTSGTIVVGPTKVQTEANASMVMTVTDGSLSVVSRVSSQSVVPGVPTPAREVCVKMELSHVKIAAEIRKCLELVAADLKPASSSGGLDTYEEDFSLGGSISKSNVTVDQQGLLHGVSSEQTVKVPQHPDVHTEMALTLTPTAGTPDAALFNVNQTGCEEQDFPALPPGAPAAMLALYKCFADAEYHTEALVV